MQSLNRKIFMSEHSTPTVLVVDDVQINVDLLAEVLSDSCSVIEATNGQIALERAFREVPDLILLDVMMPGMGGHEVCRRLKEEPKTSDIPVVFITAKGDDEDDK